jgi:hypothetical protein
MAARDKFLVSALSSHFELNKGGRASQLRLAEGNYLRQGCSTSFYSARGFTRWLQRWFQLLSNPASAIPPNLNPGSLVDCLFLIAS